MHSFAPGEHLVCSPVQAVHAANRRSMFTATTHNAHSSQPDNQLLSQLTTYNPQPNHNKQLTTTPPPQHHTTSCTQHTPRSGSPEGSILWYQDILFLLAGLPTVREAAYRVLARKSRRRPTKKNRSTRPACRCPVVVTSFCDGESGCPWLWNRKNLLNRCDERCPI